MAFANSAKNPCICFTFSTNDRQGFQHSYSRVRADTNIRLAERADSHFPSIFLKSLLIIVLCNLMAVNTNGIKAKTTENATKYWFLKDTPKTSFHSGVHTMLSAYLTSLKARI